MTTDMCHKIIIRVRWRSIAGDRSRSRDSVNNQLLQLASARGGRAEEVSKAEKYVCVANGCKQDIHLLAYVVAIT